MNVSSVKNLNGETFSAVQDATLTDVVQSNSAQWAEGGSVPVSNSGDLYKVEFDGVDLYGYKSTSSTPNYVYSAVSSNEGQRIDYSKYPTFNSVAIDNLNNWSAFDILSVSSNGNQIYPPEEGEYGYITALDVYYQASYLYDYNNNQLADFSGYIGKITLDNLVASSYFDKPSYFDDIARCSQFKLWFSGNQHEGGINNHYICSVGKEVQSGTNTISGIFIPSAIDTSNYIPYTTSGLELPNSHFKIDTSGQAYKLAIVNSAEQPLNNSMFQTDNTLSYPFGKGKHYIVNVPSSRKTFDVRVGSPYTIICSGVIQNGVCDFVYPSSGVTGYKRFYTYNDYGAAPLTTANCKLYYFTTASPSGEYVLKSDLPSYEYDSTNKISAINGSAIAAGDEFPVSADEAIQYVQTNSAGIDDTVNNVTTNSGAWGGSALPISAGPGIKVNLVDNTLVFSNDETLIFNGDVSGQVTDFNTNEQINNFEKLDVYYCCNDDGLSLLGGNITTYDTNVLTAQNQISLGGTYTISNGYTCFYNLYYTITNGSAFSCTQSKRYWLAPTATSGEGNVAYNPTTNVEKKKNGYIYKIVGINRIAGGN